MRAPVARGSRSTPCLAGGDRAEEAAQAVLRVRRGVSGLHGPCGGHLAGAGLARAEVRAGAGTEQPSGWAIFRNEFRNWILGVVNLQGLQPGAKDAELLRRNLLEKGTEGSRVRPGRDVRYRVRTGQAIVRLGTGILPCRCGGFEPVAKTGDVAR